MWRSVEVVVVVVLLLMAQVSHAGPIADDDDDASGLLGDKATPKEQAELPSDNPSLKERSESLRTEAIQEISGPPGQTPTLRRPDKSLGSTTILMRADELPGGTLSQNEPTEDRQLKAQQQRSDQITSSSPNNPPGSTSSGVQGMSRVNKTSVFTVPQL